MRSRAALSHLLIAGLPQKIRSWPIHIATWCFMAPLKYFGAFLTWFWMLLGVVWLEIPQRRSTFRRCRCRCPLLVWRYVRFEYCAAFCINLDGILKVYTSPTVKFQSITYVGVREAVSHHLRAVCAKAQCILEPAHLSLCSKAAAFYLIFCIWTAQSKFCSSLANMVIHPPSHPNKLNQYLAPSAITFKSFLLFQNGSWKCVC